MRVAEGYGAGPVTFSPFTFERLFCMVEGMKKELLQYLVGLCQGASAALLASAVIVPDMRIASLFGAYVCAMLGILFVYLKNMGG